MENRENFVVNDTRQKILGLKLELEDIFASLGLTANSNLKINDFKNLMHTIDKQLKDENIQILFSFFDKENAGFVKFNKF